MSVLRMRHYVLTESLSRRVRSNSALCRLLLDKTASDVLLLNIEEAEVILPIPSDYKLAVIASQTGFDVEQRTKSIDLQFKDMFGRIEWLGASL